MLEIADLLTQKTDPQQIFELLDILGQGSYGSVSKALHKQTGELYAIKILPATSGVEIDSIKKQIGILKQCDDDHIVRYFGSYYKDSNLWIIMEYCVAGSVTDIMQITKKKLNQYQISSILQSALMGLRYIHSKKKIHRDIKAANILLDQKGHAKLADFGVSASSMYTNARFKTHIGSPYWMSPQIIKYSEYNHKTDIWSLGITAIQLAQGQVPNSHIKPFMVIFMTKANPVQGFQNPNLWSPQFNDFTRLCLQINPQQRPEARELLQHDFIKKYSRGQRLLQQLVLSSLEQIQQFRMNQSRNSSFAEIIVDENRDTKTIIDRSRQDKKHQSNASNCYNQYDEGGSMVILSSRHSLSEAGSMIMNGSVIVKDDQYYKDNKNDNNILSHYINQLKEYNNVETQCQQLTQNIVKQINRLDEQCIQQLEEVFIKYKNKYNIKMQNLNSMGATNEKQIQRKYQSRMKQCDSMKQFVNYEVDNKKMVDIEVNSFKISQKNSIKENIQSQKGNYIKLKQPVPFKHNQSVGQKVNKEKFAFVDDRKEAQSFMSPKDTAFQKKAYIEKQIGSDKHTQIQSKQPPSHNSSRILFKNPHVETPNSIPKKKLQQFKQDPDVLQYLQKTFGQSTQGGSFSMVNCNSGKSGGTSKTKLQRYNGNKVQTEVSLKQHKSIDNHSVSRGKTGKSGKNIKAKSKNKIK